VYFFCRLKQERNVKYMLTHAIVSHKLISSHNIKEYNRGLLNDLLIVHYNNRIEKHVLRDCYNYIIVYLNFNNIELTQYT